MIPRVLFVLTLFFLLPFSLFAQKQFHLIVNLPQGIDKEKMEVWVENGKENRQIKSQLTAKTQLVLTGDYYSLYAVVSLHYPQDETTKGFTNRFFIQDKPAVITFLPSRQQFSLFNNYSLQNALDFNEEKRQMEKYVAIEGKKAKDYEIKYGDKIFTGRDTAIRNYYFKVLMPAFRKKQLEYIVKHPNSYYSFSTFRTDVAKPTVAPWDSLLLVFNSFPVKFKYSDEGNYFNEYLHARLSAGKQADAIDFTAQDIEKKKVTLSDFKGKKYVLLHFWATWCTPCLRELPALKDINDQFKQKDLQVISIALPSSKYADFLTTINKFQMGWIHVYNNPDLINKYGNEPTPRICLVDKTGKLVYDQIGLGKNEDLQLNELRKFIKETIQ